MSFHRFLEPPGPLGQRREEAAQPLAGLFIHQVAGLQIELLAREGNQHLRLGHAWGERDEPRAEQWALQEAANLGFSLDKQHARLLVARVGVDQWQLYRALEKLAVAGDITKELIENTIDANPKENVFLLFESALRGDGRRVAQMIETLQLSDDPYRLFGLLGGQAFQLLAVAISEPGTNVAKDLGVHPYALQKMSQYAKSLGPSGARRVVAAFAEADEAMKSSAADPWLLVERALIKTAEISK